MKASYNELVVLNFQIAPKVLEKKVPRGLELDFFNDETYVSLVCMVVRKVGIMGIPITRAFAALSRIYYVSRPGN